MFMKRLPRLHLLSLHRAGELWAYPRLFVLKFQIFFAILEFHEMSRIWGINNFQLLNFSPKLESHIMGYSASKLAACNPREMS